MFNELLALIKNPSSKNFDEASLELEHYIYSSDNFIDILKQIGTIPESIKHDSTAEKLFSKASDATLSRAFKEIGLKSTVLKGRGDSADVQAESIYHNYTLVADAKAFRLSRTAKNQKDFKVVALSGWRQDAEYAVLCAPYFQYFTTESQIYAQALEHNVCLLSWEHFIFLIENNIKESLTTDLSMLWTVSNTYAETCTIAQRKKSFIPFINSVLVDICQKTTEDFTVLLEQCHSELSIRASDEIAFWIAEREKIQSYTREQAITELLRARKVEEKIAHIKKYVAGIKL